ncbi:MAG: alpha/beta fold hydrolase [Gammaproteobacteria bacterium]
MSMLKHPDGSRIYYRLTGKDGDGAPLVLIHGWCSNQSLWEHQVRYFRRRHPILLLDRRGHGRSSTSGSGHDAAGHAEDIAAVVKAAGLKRVVAVGHAGGAAGTLEFVRANPRLVRAGIIVDSFLYPLPRLDDPKSAFGALLGPMIRALEGPNARSEFKRWYTSYFHPRSDRQLTRKIVAEAAKTPQAVKLAELHGMVADTEAIAAGIAQPMLWVTGGFGAGGTDQSYIARHLKKVGFAQVYGASHFPHFEQPAQVNAMIETFLSRL